jgi:NADPH-dependent 2,4-dienoyl-CoA reductase/sulfur reductase-like enzyme/Fe-S-cluster-containing hydrogenase component 2
MERILKHPVLSVPENEKKVEFFFNDKKFEGYEGEAVSSALISNNIKEFSIHKKDDAPMGIYCANGQCSHCTLIIDGLPLKSCITPLKEGMRMETLRYIPKLPEKDAPIRKFEKLEEKCDVLVVGGGPSGLTATIELAKLGFKIILVDDKNLLGGKLLLQTHKFFGSEEDCFAGTRGIDIGHKLEKEVRSYENVKIYTSTSVVGIYKDQKAGLFVDNKNYVIVEFGGIIISAGAREKSLIFPGNHLPGVYGAGAFQTLVNRDLVKSADKVFIVGSGNVGLIGAYHALQAGIKVAGICDILPKAAGYKVHADKIKRMGVPIYLNHTVLSAEGNGKVEKVTIAQVDDKYNPLLETAKTFKVDTLLVAVGLSSVDEFYNMAVNYGFKVVKAGDANEIAEASSAMFGGRIAGLEMAKILGKDVVIDKSFTTKAEVLKSRPGKVVEFKDVELTDKYQPVIHCVEEIPCNPCTSVCPQHSINLLNDHGNIMDLPEFSGECNGCQSCLSVCPGLAISLAKKLDDKNAEILLPHEFIPNFKEGDSVALMSMQGEYLEDGLVTKIRFNKKYKTSVVYVKASLKNASKIAGIRVQDAKEVQPMENASYTYLPDNGVVCQCELVTVKELVDYIKEHNVRDAAQLKPLRVGMGACGGKNCSILLPRVFQMAGVDWKQVTPNTKRPLSVEVPMYALINESDGE